MTPRNSDATSRSAGRRSARIAFLASILVIVLATLTPSSSPPVQELTGCLICGERGLADAILNLALFAPMGASIGLLGASRARALGLAIGLSALLELLQSIVPGRDPSYGDLVFNGTGAALGLFLAARLGLLARPTEPVRKALQAAVGVAFLAMTFGTGWLLTPSLPETLYYGQWTPELAHLEHYEGTVLEATLDGTALRPGAIEPSAPVREALLRGVSLSVRAEAGPPVPALAPLVSIYDGEREEIILLGPDGDDLVWRIRPRAADLRLDRPDIRWVAALRDLEEGDRFRVGAEPGSSGWCLSVDGIERCRLGATVGSGWAFLLYPEGLSTRARRAVEWGWLLIWGLSLGYWVRGDRTGVLWSTGCVLLGLGLAPISMHGLVATPWHQWLAAVVGTILGMILGRLTPTATGQESPGRGDRRQAPLR